MRGETLGQVLTRQICKGELEVEEARAIMIRFYRREKKPPRTLREIVYRAIHEALRENGDSVHRAARQLGISRATVYRLLRKAAGKTISGVR